MHASQMNRTATNPVSAIMGFSVTPLRPCGRTKTSEIAENPEESKTKEDRREQHMRGDDDSPNPEPRSAPRPEPHSQLPSSSEHAKQTSLHSRRRLALLALALLGLLGLLLSRGRASAALQHMGTPFTSR